MGEPARAERAEAARRPAKRVPRVTQAALRSVMEKRRQVGALSQQMDAAVTELRREEWAIVDALEAKAKIEQGEFTAAIAERFGRRNVAWKQELLKRIGKEAVKRIFDACRRPVFKVLEIVKREEGERA